MARGTKIGSLFGDITINTKKLDRDLRKAKRKLTAFGKTASGLGKQMALGIGAPMALFGGRAVAVFANFEQEMAKVKAISGATAEEFKALEENARRLGSSTRFTATNVSELQLNFSKLGFSATEITKVTEATLDLALATGEDLAESARVSAQTLRGFSLEANEMTRVVNVMANGFSSSALDLTKFDTAMSIVSASASNAGVSLEETTAMLSVLVDRGVDASSAGTALRNIFLTTAEKGLSMNEAFNRIEKSSNRNAVAMDIFGKRGATVATILALNRDETDELNELYLKSEGIAKEMAKIMDDTLKGAFLRVKSAVEGLQLEFAKRLAPALKDSSEKLAKFLDENKKAIADFAMLATKVGAIAITAGVFLMVLGQISFVIVNVTGAVGILAKGFNLLLTPLALVTSGLKILAGKALVGNLIAMAKPVIIATFAFGVFKGIIDELNKDGFDWAGNLADSLGIIIAGLEDVINVLADAIQGIYKLGEAFGVALDKDNMANHQKVLNKLFEIRQPIIHKLTKEEKNQFAQLQRDLQWESPMNIFNEYNEKDYAHAIAKMEDFSKHMRATYDKNFNYKRNPLFMVDGISGADAGMRPRSNELSNSELVKDIFGTEAVKTGGRLLGGDYDEGSFKDRAKKYSNMLTNFVSGDGEDGFSINALVNKVTGIFDGVTDVIGDIELDPKLKKDIEDTEKAIKDLQETGGEGEDGGFSETQFGKWTKSFSESLKAGVEELGNDTLVMRDTMVGFMQDVSNGMTDALMGFFETGKLNMRSFVSDMLRQLARMQLQQNIVNPFISGANDFISGLFGAKGKAIGGSVAKNTPYLVGEKGAELFVPDGAGKIIPNHALAGGGSMAPTIVNFHVEATDANSFDQQIAQREKMLVGMIDKAYHKRGRMGING